MPPIGLIACRVLEEEIAAFASAETPIVHREFFEIGLHDQPGVLKAKLAEAIARAEEHPAVEAVVLVYGLCGLALCGLAPRKKPLVVPRAHDCVTLYLGSKERYAETMKEDPGLYWYTPGWNRERRVAGPEREQKLRAEYSARFDPEQVEALLQMDRESFALHTVAAYTDLGPPGGDPGNRRYAESCAAALGWRFAHHPGDPALLRDLLSGRWDDDRFLVVRPGQQIAHSPDAAVIKAVPAG